MRRNMLLKSDKAGFTLVEIMVSMIVLALLASGFFSILVSARYMVNRTAFRSAGTALARAELERMRTLVAGDTWAVAGSPLLATGAWTAWVPCPTNANFMTRYRVDPVTNRACRAVTVQVRWNVPKI